MASATSPRGRSALSLENPFSFKIGQVFTGVGVGCGVGVGVGRPIYLGAIPVFQQVLSATRGATDVLSGSGRHVNAFLKKTGLKSIEVGVGCGVGVGYGFGVGIALKPGVVHAIQSSFGEAVTTFITSLKTIPGVSSASSLISGSVPSTISALGGSSINNMQPLSAARTELDSKATNSTLQHTSYANSLQEPVQRLYEQKGILSEKSAGSRNEKVVADFLQNPPFQNDAEMDGKETAGNLRAMNSILQMLLKHQQEIEELMEENQKMRQILAEDLKVPTSRLQLNRNSRTRPYFPCSDCFECRSKSRKAAR